MLPPSARPSAARPASILRAALALLITATGAPPPSPPSRAARCGRWRCRPTGPSSSPSTRPTTGSRSSRSRRAGSPTPARSRSASSRSPSPRARTPRSGWSTISPTASASSTSAPRRRASCARCSSATSRATSSSPARGGTRAFITTAHRGQNVPGRSRSSPRPGVGRADVWVFDADQPRRHARRHAAHHRHALRRHAARARASARTAARSTRPSSTPATRPRRSPKARSATAARRAAPCTRRRRQMPGGLPAPNANVQGVPQPGDRPHRQVQRRDGHWVDELGRNWNNARALLRCPTRTSSRSTPTPARRSQTAELRRRRHRPLQHGRSTR